MMIVGRVPVLSKQSRWIYGEAAKHATRIQIHQSGEPLSSSDPIVALENAVLGYPDASKTLGPVPVSIHHPSTGGHVLLGANGSGKSLIAYTLASLNDDAQSPYLRSGSYTTEISWHRRSIAKVSFQSHKQLLTQGGTVSKAISEGGNLSKAAKFLIVRFGLYHHLHRQVKTLSTGEIRKVLLIRALATRPRLLLLDNAFDGLDVETRETLKDLVSRTIQGFRPDILVQAVSAKATAHTQVLLMTNRAEEVVDDIRHVSYLDAGRLRSVPRNGASGEALLLKAMGQESAPGEDSSWNHSSPLPSLEEITRYWQDERPSSSDEKRDEAVIRSNGLHVEKSGVVLLCSLTWEVKRGERWLIAGRNGAGKSTLSHFLARLDRAAEQDEHLSVLSNETRGDDGRRQRVGWCSIELHLALTLEKSGLTVQKIFEKEGASPAMMVIILSWLGLTDQSIQVSSFSQLSQGQQKLVLIGAAIASRPEILILDEITQGLDMLNRDRVLALVELICEATDVTLIYITHHLEEILPSITHILHLARGETLYRGTMQAYDARAVKALESEMYDT